MTNKDFWFYIVTWSAIIVVFFWLLIVLTYSAKADTVVASYYGRELHGRRTASGERFNMNALTAAHKHLPFGTRLRVTNVRNGRSVVVRLNDRGPWIRGRSLDLSHGAARVIGLPGVGRVHIERVR